MRHVLSFDQQGAVLVDVGVVLGRPWEWDGAFGVTHHPVGREDLVEVLC